jgi:hypothetical protein
VTPTIPCISTLSDCPYALAVASRLHSSCASFESSQSLKYLPVAASLSRVLKTLSPPQAPRALAFTPSVVWLLPEPQWLDKATPRGRVFCETTVTVTIHIWPRDGDYWDSSVSAATITDLHTPTSRRTHFTHAAGRYSQAAAPDAPIPAALAADSLAGQQPPDEPHTHEQPTAPRRRTQLVLRLTAVQRPRRRGRGRRHGRPRRADGRDGPAGAPEDQPGHPGTHHSRV